MSKLNQHTTDPLSVEEEAELVKRWRDHGDVKARDRVIFANLRFAMATIASAQRIAEQDDLEQETVVGMLHALKTYEPERGFRFVTYAIHQILVSIERAEIAARNIRLPPDAFHAAIGKKPSDLSEESALAARIAAQPMARLDQRAFPENFGGSGGRITPILLAEHIPCETSDAPDDETDAIAGEIMSRATPLEKLVLTRLFYDDKGCADIGKEIGVSKEGARQLKDKALARLRARGRTNIPAYGDEWWKDEAYVLRKEFDGRAVKFRTLRAWAARRYVLSARRYLFNLLAWMTLEGRAEWFGDTVRFGGRRAKLGAARRTRNVAI